jgi:hypothetical protein
MDQSNRPCIRSVKAPSPTTGTFRVTSTFCRGVEVTVITGPSLQIGYAHAREVICLAYLEIRYPSGARVPDDSSRSVRSPPNRQGSVVVTTLWPVCCPGGE